MNWLLTIFVLLVSRLGCSDESKAAIGTFNEKGRIFSIKRQQRIGLLQPKMWGFNSLD